MTTTLERQDAAAIWARRPRPWGLHPRHRLDISPCDLAPALPTLLASDDAERRERALEATLGADETIICFSVRSGFELALDALDLPRGSEILASAITHPDMARIAERHGLVVVPVDLDLETLAPRVELLEAALSPRTRVVLVAHLFGTRIDLGEVVAFARRHGLLLFEDCAQSLRGPGDRGDPRADVSMFSFGSIKTSAALGGAIVYVRRPDLAAGMRRRHGSWPRQPRREYLVRAFRFCGLRLLENPWIYGTFVRLGTVAGADVDDVVNGAVRALRPPAAEDDAGFERWLRRRPSAPLLAVLAARLGSFDPERLRRRAELGDELARRLPAGVFHPGDRAAERTHWVFPVLSADPAGTIAALRAAGFDATRATTSIAALRSADPARSPSEAARLMRGVVFVPAYPELPARAVERLVEALSAGREEPLR